MYITYIRSNFPKYTDARSQIKSLDLGLNYGMHPEEKIIHE